MNKDQQQIPPQGPELPDPHPRQPIQPGPQTAPTNNVDAKIAAEHNHVALYNAYNQDPNAVPVSVPYDYGYNESIFSRIISKFMDNRLLFIPVAVVLVIIIGSIIGVSVSSSKKNGGIALKDITETSSSDDASNSLATESSDPNSTSNGGSSTSSSAGGITTLPSGIASTKPPTTSTTKPPVVVPAKPPVAPTPPQPPATPAQPGAKKVLLFVEENNSFSAVTATSMPYAYSLTRQYNWATNYTFLNGDSLPNYVAMSAGTMAGSTNASKAATLNEKTVFKQVLDSGRTAKTYILNMAGNCRNSGSGGNYSDNHNPWVYFKNEKTECTKYNVPYAGNFDADVKAGNLPNFGMIVPDNDWNGHDRSLKYADDWFKARMQTVFAGPDWTSGRLAIIFVFDEPKKKTQEKIYMSVIHPSTKGKGAVGTQLNHYSITRLGAEMIGAQPLAYGATANSIVGAFGLRL